MDQLGYPTSAQQMHGRLAALLADPASHTVVAQIDGHIGGMAGMRVGTDDARGQGVGAHLLEEVDRWCGARGADAMIVNSGRRRGGAHRFYERHGYVRTGIRLMKVVEPS